MSEIFDIIVAINKLRQEIADLSARIKNLCKYPSLLSREQYVDDEAACKILHVSKRAIVKMRSAHEIAFVRHHRKILYSKVAIEQYLKHHSIVPAKSDITL